MGLQVGERVPDFPAHLSDGLVTSLARLLEAGPIVLFFYPKAFTPGCSAQSCRFRDLSSDLAEVGARPIGISSDDPRTQLEFAKSNRLGYQLISDQDGTIAKIFGAKRLGLPFDKRMTFVIGQDRRILAVIKNELDMNIHADYALDVLRANRAESDLVVPQLEIEPN